METRYQHFEHAETLLAEGRAVVGKIAALNELRRPEGAAAWPDLTRQMDELGKKAMGIWAQAQVHATLASAYAWYDGK